MKKHFPAIIAAFLGLAILFIAQALAYSPDLKVWFFDVGQGDAIFIETPQSYQILIDGGPDARVLEKLGSHMPFWDRSLDLVILTHPDSDHVTGLISVLEQYEVAMIVESGIRKETILSQAWDEAVKNEEATLVYVDQPKRIWIGNSLVLDLLWPHDHKAGQIFDSPNDFSIVAQLIYGKTSFLLPGDIERWTEQQLLEHQLNLDSDILKVAHHGSKTSTSQTFLEAVSPEIAIISVGENRYGHPHPWVLNRLQSAGAQILRTDQQGDILIRSDGNHISVH